MFACRILPTFKTRGYYTCTTNPINWSNTSRGSVYCSIKQYGPCCMSITSVNSFTWNFLHQSNISFYSNFLRFYDSLERDYVIYVHIDVNLDGRGGFAAARRSIVKKEIGGALAWNRGHLPFKCWCFAF